jgi:PAS domain S-box-containing protein
MNTGEPIINKVEKLTHSDGSEKWISVTKIPHYNAEGDIVGTMGISRDITMQEKAKEELAVSEERYRAVFENSSFAIVLTNEDKNIVSWNKLVEDLFDMGYDELYMKPVQSLYPSNEWERIQAQYAQDVGIKSRIETKIVRKDRRVIDVDLSVNVLKNNEGKILGSTEIIYDISKRKKAEKELEKKHELLTTLMENIPDSVYFKDDENKFILVNKAKAQHSNVTLDEMIGKTDFDFLPEEQAKQVFDDDNRIKQTGEPIINKVEKLTHSGGSEKWISVTKIPRYNAEGDIVGTMGISRDITEWKNAEEELAKEHELLQTLMDNIPDSIYFKDDNNKFILVNKAKADHWNVKPEDMVGKTDFDFLPHDQAQKAIDDDNRILKGERVIDKIEKITGSDGLERWFSVIKVPRYDKDGNIVGTIGISRNVTEWKKLDDIRKDLIAKQL